MSDTDLEETARELAVRVTRRAMNMAARAKQARADQADIDETEIERTAYAKRQQEIDEAWKARESADPNR